LKEKLDIKLVGRPNAVRKVSGMLSKMLGCTFSFPKTGDQDPTTLVVYTTTVVETGDVIASAKVEES